MWFLVDWYVSDIRLYLLCLKGRVMREEDCLNREKQVEKDMAKCFRHYLSAPEELNIVTNTELTGSHRRRVDS
jgi:hypothetical protein